MNMPQMSPLAWAPLMVITTMLMLLISSHIFWTEVPKMSELKTTPSLHKQTWKW
uniref:ATP synthase F0 subunit 8 n=1 Tax=Strigamia maritima TaxID=126957 RepID=A0A0C5APN6_STRMM|nr:ATP synthase F0 subunit 8 [Strigamia maritima]AJK90880.1 ATP synthase F0 subunit 8 [Strigamia maritima]